MKANAQVPHNFTFNSTATTTGEISVNSPRSTSSVMGYNFLTAYEGEFEFDKYAVYHFNSRGIDRGFTVRYGKNLLTIEQEESISNVYTGVYPFWQGPRKRQKNSEHKSKSA